jgi:galactofuranosylgalactofuranosylrhamnosyl-N-acetylglucosaminyl-diphospho-decaprenol beta-1,5/1,6-galactofuranosyltransferase
VEVHQRLYREWPRLAQTYREALGDITSPERWSKTFAQTGDGEVR